MALRRKTRWSIAIVAMLAIVAVVVVGVAYIASQKSARTPQRDAKGPFAAAPALAAKFSPGDFGMTSFVPVHGTGNTVGPVAYGQARLIAGATKSGATVVASLDGNGRAKWQTSLVGPLIACATTAQGALIPCLVKSSTGAALAAVDVNTGVSRWIFEDSRPYLNVMSSADGNFTLLGEDMSLTPVSPDGTVQGETKLPQAPADKQLTPDPGGCGLGASSTQVPERFAALSQNLWIISHGGLNTLITPDNNQVVAAIPGTLLTSTSPGGALVIAPQGGCTPAAIIHPGRAQIQLLPPNVAVPVATDGTIPDVVLRAGKLHTVNWDGPAVGARAYRKLDVTFKGAPRILQDQQIAVVAGDNHVTGFTRKNGQELWQAGVALYAMAIAGDVLLTVDDQGRVAGRNLYSGEILWEADEVALGTLTVVDDSTFQVASQTGLVTWKTKPSAPQTPATGRASDLTATSPSIAYVAGGCVRVTKIEGEDKAYTATSQRVNCDLEGAEPIVGVLTTSQIARGGEGAAYLEQCIAISPGATSALTVTSPLADPSLAAVCTGAPKQVQQSGPPKQLPTTTQQPDTAPTDTQ